MAARRTARGRPEAAATPSGSFAPRFGAVYRLAAALAAALAANLAVVSAGVLLTGVLAGCDDPPPPRRTAAEPARDVAVLTVLAQLEPNRPTHLAATRDATYMVQFEPRGTDAVFRVPEVGVPESTGLSVLRLAEAIVPLYPGAPLNELRGNFTSIAPAPDGDLFFYFRGSAGLQSVCVLGRYDVQRNVISPIAGTERLSSVSQMRNLELAGGSLVPTYTAAGSDVWLWLRSPTEPGRLLRFDVAATSTAARLEMPFAQAVSDGVPVSLNGLDDTMGYDANGRLILVSRTDGLLYRIEASGSGVMLLTLRDLPGGVTAPVPFGDGQLVFFAPEVARDPTDLSLPTAMLSEANMPGFVRLDDRDVRLLEEPKITAPPQFATFALSLGQLHVTPEPYAFVAYDQASGSVVRVRLPATW